MGGILANNELKMI